MVTSEQVKEHEGHQLEVTTWDGDIIYLKCLDCDEVLVDHNSPGIDGQVYKAEKI